MSDLVFRFGAISTTKPEPLWKHRDTPHISQGVSGCIEGIVTEQGVPVSRMVMAYHRRTGVLSASAKSSTDGSYRIDGLVAGVNYFVTSIDDNGDDYQFNAVTQDLVRADAT